MFVILFSLINVFPCAIGIKNIDQKILNNMSSQSLFNLHLDAFLKAGEPNKLGVEAGAGVKVNMGGATVSSILHLLPAKCFTNMKLCSGIKDNILSTLSEERKPFHTRITGHTDLRTKKEKYQRLMDTIIAMNDYSMKKMAELANENNEDLIVGFIKTQCEIVSTEFTNLVDQSHGLLSQLENLVKEIWDHKWNHCVKHAKIINSLADQYQKYINGMVDIKNVDDFNTQRDEWFKELDKNETWSPRWIMKSLNTVHKCVQGDSKNKPFFTTYQKKFQGNNVFFSPDDVLYSMAVAMQWFQDLFQEGNILLSIALSRDLHVKKKTIDEVLTQIQQVQVDYLVKGINSYATFWEGVELYHKYENFYCSSGVLAMLESDERNDITCTSCWKHVHGRSRGSQCSQLLSFAGYYEKLRSLWDPLWTTGTNSMTNGDLGVYYTDTLLSEACCINMEDLNTNMESYFTDIWVIKKCEQDI